MKILPLVAIFVSHVVASFDALSGCPLNLTRGSNLWSYSDWCLQVNLWNHHGLHNHDWFHARDNCRKKGGELIQIRDADMQDFIKAKLLEQHYDKTWRFWIGSSDREHEGKWQWISDPKHMEYSNWSPGQGSDQHGFLFIPGGGTEDCAILDIHDNARWHDYPCSAGAGFWFSHICQFKKLPFTNNLRPQTSRSTSMMIHTKSEIPQEKATKTPSSTEKLSTKFSSLSSFPSSKPVVSTERQSTNKVTYLDKTKSTSKSSKSTPLMEILSSISKSSSIDSFKPSRYEGTPTIPSSKSTKRQTFQQPSTPTAKSTTTQKDIGIIIG